MQQSARRLIDAKVSELLTQAHIVEPPVDIEQVAEKLGLRIAYEALPETISGFLHRDHAVSTIVVNKRQVKQRQRFTLAHEIGHYVLGHATDEIHVDRHYQIALRHGDETVGGVKYRKKRAVGEPSVSDRDEVQANAFAAALLMPKAMLTKDMQAAVSSGMFDDSLIDELTKRYRVSTQALMIQLNTLHLTPAFLP